MRDKIIQDIRESIAVKTALLESASPLIEKAARTLAECLKRGNKALFFGNGGSAADSQHLAAEIVGRYEKERKGFPAIAFTTDTSVLTSVGNDYGFERVFERQMEALGRKGDIAFAISTSGNSKNVNLAVKRARELGVFTVALTGRSGGDLKGLADLAIVVPSQKTARIQESHILIGHIICERVDEIL